MIRPTEIRLVGCSAVALLMMSIPGLATRSFYPTSQPVFEAKPSAVASPVEAQPVKPERKKRSFFHRASLTGLASWYGPMFNGHKTANGETFDETKMTACHRTLPFGTMVRVIDLHSGRSVIVRINDRGLAIKNRIIDLSLGAAQRLGIQQNGLARVRLEILSKRQAEIARRREKEKAAEAATEVAQTTAHSSPVDESGGDQ